MEALYKTMVKCICSAYVCYMYGLYMEFVFSLFFYCKYFELFSWQMKFETCEGNEIFLFVITLRIILGTTHPFIQMMMGILSLSYS
jgi:hypothetical protein